MRRIRKFIAVGGAGLLVTLALTSSALAAGSVRSATAGRAITLPNSNIKGTPALFSPSTLTAKARETTACNSSQGSFTIANLKSVSEKISFTGTNLNPSSLTIPAKRQFVFCLLTGYTGTVHGKLNDGKKLTVAFP